MTYDLWGKGHSRLPLQPLQSLGEISSLVISHTLPKWSPEISSSWFSSHTTNLCRSCEKMYDEVLPKCDAFFIIINIISHLSFHFGMLKVKDLILFAALFAALTLNSSGILYTIITMLHINPFITNSDKPNPRLKRILRQEKVPFHY